MNVHLGFLFLRVDIKYPNRLVPTANNYTVLEGMKANTVDGNIV